MKRCRRCSRPGEVEFLGGYCGWCEKIIGDVQAELAAELAPGEW